jgi:hypothetical protein
MIVLYPSLCGWSTVLVTPRRCLVAKVMLDTVHSLVNLLLWRKDLSLLVDYSINRVLWYTMFSCEI